jgi:hypothetical protein
LFAADAGRADATDDDFFVNAIGIAAPMLGCDLLGRLAKCAHQ